MQNNEYAFNTLLTFHERYVKNNTLIEDFIVFDKEYTVIELVKQVLYYQKQLPGIIKVLMNYTTNFDVNMLIDNQFIIEHALNQEKYDIVEELIDNGAIVHFKAHYSKFESMEQLVKNEISSHTIIKAMDNNYMSNNYYYNGYNLMVMFADYDRYDVVELLIKNGADINCYSKGLSMHFVHKLYIDGHLDLVINHKDFYGCYLNQSKLLPANLLKELKEKIKNYPKINAKNENNNYYQNRIDILETRLAEANNIINELLVNSTKENGKLHEKINGLNKQVTVLTEKNKDLQCRENNLDVVEKDNDMKSYIVKLNAEICELKKQNRKLVKKFENILQLVEN